jgi:hypothetical protein
LQLPLQFLDRLIAVFQLGLEQLNMFVLLGGILLELTCLLVKFEFKHLLELLVQLLNMLFSFLLLH